MNIPFQNQEHREPTDTETRPEPRAIDSSAELREHLLRAATGAAAHGVDVDQFMRVAWLAYMEANPGLREQLEDLQLAAQVEALRRNGRVGQA
jgi:hypothetical protein